MWIVKLALNRPYTFVVMSLLIALLGGMAIWTMPTDILPVVDIPVVSVIWQYGGISPDEMAGRITTIAERAMTTAVNDIEHMESSSLNGVAAIKVFFQPGAKVELAVAQIASVMSTILRILPPGITPPLIVKYNASSVPILQLGLASPTMSESAIYDQGFNFIRTQLATVQGASIPLPYGGKQRQVMVDLDPGELYARGLSAADVSAALNAQSLILPAGSVKIGDRELNVRLNSAPLAIAELADLPVRQIGPTTVHLRDVGQAKDGFAVQTNIVRQDGRRGALLTVLKNGSASTLSILDRIKAALVNVRRTVPPELEIKELFDQGVFVRSAIQGVVREGLISAALTGLMILLFLGSWRSTLIVSLSIPLSILVSFIVMAATGQTINSMTLGGLALAVGILVDDATVEIENIHRNLSQKKSIVRAILDGAQQIAVPAFVSTLCICVVFVPVTFLSGAAKYLFTPLAVAVVVSMLASYLLSRTIIPTLVRYLLASEVELYRAGEHAEVASDAGIIWRVHGAFNRRFEAFRASYRRLLESALADRLWSTALFAAFVATGFILLPSLGRDFFPTVDAGQMRLHVRAPAGTRIEATEQLFGRIEQSIRRLIPARELETILDNIGVPEGINLAFGDNASIGSGDGEILIALSPEHAPTEGHVSTLRRELQAEFPDETFFFQPASISNQILNFGLPAPIDVQVVGRNVLGNYKVARGLEAKMALVRGAADVHLHQELDYPQVRVDVDREKASELGLTQRDVANSLLISLSSSRQLAPNYWLNPANGVSYNLAVQTPQHRIHDFETLASTPIAAPGAGTPQLLSNLATLARTQEPAIVSHYNVQPTFDVYANVDGRDLGGVADDVAAIVERAKAELPRGSSLVMRGQVETMNSSFRGLGLGMIVAVILVYLLMAVNFQSWLDPFIILTALPGAFAGIVWMLHLTKTTISVPALMGTIMAVGVATSNSILLVTFANDKRREGLDAAQAALAAGVTRLRPIAMTALAMIVGMLPMALGLGEGGDQNAPLGRAVVGGLIAATVSTLFFVPVVYSRLRRTPPSQGDDDPDLKD